MLTIRIIYGVALCFFGGVFPMAIAGMEAFFAAGWRRAYYSSLYVYDESRRVRCGTAAAQQQQRGSGSCADFGLMAASPPRDAPRALNPPRRAAPRRPSRSPLSYALELDDLEDLDKDGIADVDQISSSELVQRKSRLAFATVQNPDELQTAFTNLWAA